MSKAISNTMGVMLMLILVILLAVIAIGAFFMFDVTEPTVEDTNLKIEGSTIEVVSGEGGKIKIVNSKGDVIERMKAKTGNTMDLSTKVTAGTTLSVVSEENGEKLETWTVDSNDVKFKDPATLTSEDVKLSRTFKSDVLSRIENPSNRYIGSSEVFTVEFKDNYDPNDFTYTWSSSREGYDLSISRNGSSATYNYYDLTTYTNGDPWKPSNIVKASIKYNGTTIKRWSKDFYIVNAIQDVETEKLGYNEGYLKNLNTYDTRFIGFSEDLKLLRIEVDDQLSNSIDETDLSNFEFEWVSNREGNELSIKNDKKRVATYDYYGKTTYTNGQSWKPNNLIAVRASVKGVDSSNTIEVKSAYVKYPVQSVEYESTGYYDNGTKINYEEGDSRMVDTEEEFQISNIQLHSDISDELNSKKSNFEIDWYWDSRNVNKKEDNRFRYTRTTTYPGSNRYYSEPIIRSKVKPKGADKYNTFTHVNKVVRQEDY